MLEVSFTLFLYSSHHSYWHVQLETASPNPATATSPLLLNEADFSISAEPVDVSGGSCDLFSAHHKRFGLVAMKRLRCNPSQRDDAIRVGLRPQFSRLSDLLTMSWIALQRFFREGRTWSGLNHPHVLSFHGFCQTPSHIYLISPFVEYGALHRYLKIYPDANRARLVGSMYRPWTLR